MKFFLSISFLLSIFFSYGIYLSFYQIKITEADLRASDPKGYYNYKGIINVHSNASTGSGTYTEILEQAQNAQVSFLVFTEVNLPSRPHLIEGYFHNIAVLAGGEYSYFDSRLLYIGGTPNQPPQGQSQTQVFFADLLSLKDRANDILILAHPFYSRYSWKGDYPVGLDGIEILNLKSIFSQTWDHSKIRSIGAFLIYPFNPSMAYAMLLSTPGDELLLWDKLNKSRKAIGFAGNDTTSKISLSGKKHLKIPSYETSFNLISNHLLITSELTGNFSRDKIKILDALKNGQFYMAADLLGSTRGFSVEIKDEDRSYLQGSKIKLKKSTQLIVDLPDRISKPFQVKIVKDGEEYSRSTSKKTTLKLSAPGVYRAEVFVNPQFPVPGGNRWLPWIITNNFYIYD